ncbi:MAG: PIN domain-containing protein [Thermofilaceae archaeon]
MLVLDTNVLVYASVEDSEFHEESLKLLNERDSVIPQIVVYEYIRVIAELTRDPLFVLTKIRELAEYNVLCEPLHVVQRGVQLWAERNAPIRELNDCVILALALTLNAELATYDRKLRRLAEELGVPTRP